MQVTSKNISLTTFSEIFVFIYKFIENNILREDHSGTQNELINLNHQ